MDKNNSNLKGSGRREYRYHAVESNFLPFVLYVVNDDYHLLLVKKILDHIPEINFQHSASAKNAFSVALKDKPHLILIDLDMQATNGFELQTLLREHPLTRKTPVFALSSSTFPHDQEKIRKAGFKRHIPKPIKVHEFFNSVNQELEDIYQQSQLP